jgi:hypothetical protein
MLITEVANFFKCASKDQIRNLLEDKNDTGIKTDILSEFVYLANNDQLWRPISLEKLLEDKRPKTKSDDRKPAIVVKTCPLFDETFLRAVQLKGDSFRESFKRFLEFKEQAAESGNPVQPYGARDRPFIPNGQLRNAVPNETLVHVHLSHDLNLVYSMTGRDPVVYKLYGFFTHDDLGTGQPPNIRKQKQQRTALANQSDWKNYAS